MLFWKLRVFAWVVNRNHACPLAPQKTLAKTAGETKAEKTGPQAKFVTTNNTYCITHSFWERKNDSVPRNGVWSLLLLTNWIIWCFSTEFFMLWHTKWFYLPTFIVKIIFASSTDISFFTIQNLTKVYRYHEMILYLSHICILVRVHARNLILGACII